MNKGEFSAALIFLNILTLLFMFFSLPHISSLSLLSLSLSWSLFHTHTSHQQPPSYSAPHPCFLLPLPHSPLAVVLHRHAGRKERPDPLGTGRLTHQTELPSLDLSERVAPCACRPSMLRPNFLLPEGTVAPFNQI